MASLCKGSHVISQWLLHLVAAHRFRVEAFEPFLQTFGVPLIGDEVDSLGVVDNGILDEDRCLRAERQGDGVAWAASMATNSPLTIR